MVAQDAEHAVRRAERRERVGRRADVAVILRAPADVVAAQHDEIGTFGHQRRDGPRDVLVRDPDASMDVGEETDPKPRERRRQAGHAHGRARDGEFVTADRESVAGGADAGAGRSKRQRPERRAA